MAEFPYRGILSHLGIRKYSGHKFHFFPHPRDFDNPFSSLNFGVRERQNRHKAPKMRVLTANSINKQTNIIYVIELFRHRTMFQLGLIFYMLWSFGIAPLKLRARLHRMQTLKFCMIGCPLVKYRRSLSEKRPDFRDKISLNQNIKK